MKSSFRTAICDDEQEGPSIIRHHIENYMMESGNEFSCSFFDKPDELMRIYRKPGSFDILFLDVEMSVHGETENGIDLARKIRALPDQDVRIIFLSNYPSYMQQGYDVQASHYLEKDVSDERFRSVMDTILYNLQKDGTMLRVYTDPGQWNLLKIKDILYLQSTPGVRNRLEVYMLTQKITVIGRSIQSFEAELCRYGFCFANKNYLVNMRHVTQFTHDCLLMADRKYIEISRHFQHDFHNQFSSNLLDP